ncbi:glycoside hydrolase family 16 protein [Coprinellus micaceus]|uniref:Glycoside hydrolase family 16 protein n=1 Tax=Coprinellus micaceus TaxID=71717 RepID=A0A4Y7S2G2_COPMI|nr:glycoside hydrolase family 16 protein [Coprinellus micaceus]
MVKNPLFTHNWFPGALADLHSQKPGHGHEHGHGGHAIPGYRLTNSIVGRDFFRAFDWEAISDPTRGRVPEAENLTYAHGDSFVLRGDSETILTPDGPGRPSARIVSKKSYTTHVVVVDLRHMPQGCGYNMGPIWQVGKEDWPNRGEVDILEGVNDQGPNASTLHTSTNCTMPAVRNQTGTSGQLDCDVAVNWNTGCGVKFSKPNSYGPDFNKNGGGWLAVERNNQFIKTWFWPRDSQDVPRDGIPEAFFPNTECDLETHFKEHHIVINLTFCGDWAGQADVYRSSGCPSTCVAFKDAYFNFKSLRVYQ